MPHATDHPTTTGQQEATSRSDSELRRLANGVVWPGFTGVEAPEWLERELAGGLAGVVYFGQNVEDAAQVRALSDRIHRLRPDALIGVDEEGGTVTRLEVREGSSTPGNAVLGRLDDVELTERAAAWTGALVAAAGIDIDLAPSVDVNVDPRNPVIGVRSFGADASLVARQAEAAVRGLQSAGIAACAKHFPGHGDTSTDSHLALAVTNAGPDALTDVHLPPFAAAIEAGVAMVMSAHIRVPHLGDAPATLNPRALSLLRDLGFEGVIVSDALDMAAIRAGYGLGPGAVAALQAGIDLLCVGNPAENGSSAEGRTDENEFLEVRDALVAAMRSGELAVAVVEDAAERVAALAASLRSARGRSVAGDFPATDWTGVAGEGLEVVGHVRLASGPVTLVDARTKRNLAAGSQPDHFTRALSERREVDRIWLSSTDPSAAAAEAVAALAEAAAPVLVVNQPQSSVLEAEVLRAVLERRPDTVVIVAGWPLPAGERAGEPANVVYPYGSARVNAEAVARVLCGEA
ncbi:glycoside hydrolase family 3 N-terminal domain-containing protein [Leifsonia sp. F6_8S_P_1B]|uniref:Glycoside hydrolase family 3 N-terminal domain-containing protein n=1 Tax=Leifsonia williamsii TaxID=3035919 RepID=A0ABT8K8A0_9MICO|nr:glycoside hydrolase family 3 N-terminal domain-containing protein [Leifsonia williamsii]MDN4613685.1 glycoside hydrolase family 3 N-terminal domain-containing protein [Leifsonia williamsii]